MRKKLLSMLALMLFVSTGAWAWTSGNCEVTLSGGVLTVSKTSDTGAMADYSGPMPPDWSGNPSITSIVVEEGVTRIGNYAFTGCSTATSISLPTTLETIGDYAFFNCDNAALTSITIPENVTTIGDHVFRGCWSLTTVTLNSNPTISTSAFTAIPTVTMNLTAHEGETGEFWMTFYNQNYGFVADANTQIFKAALSGTALTLTELETDKIVKKNNAVILKSTASPIVMTLTSTASINDFSGNSLQGVSAAAGLTASDPSTTFVLNNGTGGVGFYRLKSGKTVGVGKAYLTYSGAFAREFFGFEETTGIVELKNSRIEELKSDDAWYSLDGRKLDGKPTTKGLYIVNGKKVIK